MLFRKDPVSERTGAKKGRCFMLHEEIMKYVPENLKESVRSTYIDELGYLIFLTDDYVVNTSGINLGYIMFKMSPDVNIPYYFNHVYKIEEAPEQEREEEEEEPEELSEEEFKELDQLTDEDLAGIHDPNVDYDEYVGNTEIDVQTDTFNPDDCVISLGINLYLPCKSRTEYEDKCIEFTKNTLNDTYNALCQIAYIVGNSLGYNVTKTDVDVRYSATSCSPFDYYCFEQEREEETSVDLIKDRKTEYVDDYHVRFLRSEMIIIQQALHYYASNHSLHNEHKLIFEYVSKLVDMAVLCEYDSAVFHVDCDPSPDDELLF